MKHIVWRQPDSAAAVDRADEAEPELAVAAGVRITNVLNGWFAVRRSRSTRRTRRPPGCHFLPLKTNVEAASPTFGETLTLCAPAGAASTPSASTVATSGAKSASRLHACFHLRTTLPKAPSPSRAGAPTCSSVMPGGRVGLDEQRRGRARPRPRWCSARRASRRSRPRGGLPAYSSIASSFQCAVPNTARPSKVRTGSSSSGRSSRRGRYSFAFSSQPVAQTSSKVPRPAGAGAARRRPRCSGRSRPPSGTGPVGRRPDGNPNRLITPSTSTNRIGRWVVGGGTFARLRGRGR